MKRWIEFVAVLYPRSWREEFGQEFGALLDDVKPSWRVLRNVLGGAIEMQVTTGTSWIKMVGAMAALGAILAFGLSFRVAPLYVSSATISVTPQADPVRPTSPEVLRERAAERIAGMEVGLLSRTNLSAIINDPRLNLYREEARRKPIEDVIGEMRQNIRIEARPSADDGLAPVAFNISFSYPDQAKAQTTARALADKFVEENANINKANGDAYSAFWRDMAAREHTKPAPPPPAGEVVRVMDPASRPVEAQRPNRLIYAAWGVGLGLVLGLLTAFAMPRRHGIRRLVGFGMAGLILAGAASQLIPNRYTSSGVMQVTPAQVTEDPVAPLLPATPAAEFLRQMNPQVLSFQSLSKIIGDPRLNLYEGERATKPMKAVVENMLANDLHIEPLSPDSGGRAAISAFRITFSYSDRHKAQQVIWEIMSRFDEVNQEQARSNVSQSVLRLAIWQRKAGELLDVTDTATLPTDPSKPNRLVIALLGLGAGLLVAVITLLRQRPRTPEPQPA